MGNWCSCLLAGTGRVIVEKMCTSLFDTSSNLELFAQVLLGKACCTEKVDMYSYGVVLWELCTGESPPGRQLRPVR